MKKAELIKILKLLKKDLYEKFGIKKIALFSSFARDEANKNSDIDIVILKVENKNYFNRIRAKYF